MQSRMIHLLLREMPIGIQPRIEIKKHVPVISFVLSLFSLYIEYVIQIKWNSLNLANAVQQKTAIYMVGV